MCVFSRVRTLFNFRRDNEKVQTGHSNSHSNDLLFLFFAATSVPQSAALHFIFLEANVVYILVLLFGSNLNLVLAHMF